MRIDINVGKGTGRLQCDRCGDKFTGTLVECLRSTKHYCHQCKVQTGDNYEKEMRKHELKGIKEREIFLRKQLNGLKKCPVRHGNKEIGYGELENITKLGIGMWDKNGNWLEF